MSSNSPLNLSSGTAPLSATDAVLVPSVTMPENAHKIRGVDFDHHREKDITVPELVANMATMGFQASAVAEAVRIIDDMVCSRSNIIPFRPAVRSNSQR